MTSGVCVICLEADNQLTELCNTCRESLICRPCLEETGRRDQDQILMNCPICREPSILGRPIPLSTTWHVMIYGIWFLTNSPISHFTRICMLMASNKYMDYICRTINRRDDHSNPRMLRSRWRLWTWITFLPYIISITTLTMPPDQHIYLFLGGHLFFPLVSTAFLYSLKYILQSTYRL